MVGIVAVIACILVPSPLLAKGAPPRLTVEEGLQKAVSQLVEFKKRMAEAAKRQGAGQGLSALPSEEMILEFKTIDKQFKSAGRPSPATVGGVWKLVAYAFNGVNSDGHSGYYKAAGLMPTGGGQVGLLVLTQEPPLVQSPRLWAKEIRLHTLEQSGSAPAVVSFTQDSMELRMAYSKKAWSYSCRSLPQDYLLCLVKDSDGWVEYSGFSRVN